MCCQNARWNSFKINSNGTNGSPGMYLWQETLCMNCVMTVQASVQAYVQAPPQNIKKMKKNRKKFFFHNFFPPSFSPRGGLHFLFWWLITVTYSFRARSPNVILKNDVNVEIWLLWTVTNLIRNFGLNQWIKERIRFALVCRTSKSVKNCGHRSNFRGHFIKFPQPSICSLL